MRKVTLTVIASMLAVSASAALAAGSTSGNTHRGCGMNNVADGYSGMFRGITFTEQQRQQMRDLMRQSYQTMPKMDASSMETLHKLVTAEKFDETAVRQQIESSSMQNINRRVEMMKTRNQMYNLLSPEQKSEIEKNYQQRVKDFQQRAADIDAASE